MVSTWPHSTTKLTRMQRSGCATSSRLGTSPLASWTSETSVTSLPQTSTASHSVTSLPASEGGAMPSDLQGGATISPSGQEVVHVSRFRARDSGKATPTEDTSGPLFSALSLSARLQWSLENKLQAKMASNGSLEYALISKTQDMPAGPPIYALLGRAHPTSDSGYSGWPTPTASENGGNILRKAERRKAAKVKWKGVSGNGFGWSLAEVSAGTADNIGGVRLTPAHSCWLMGFPEEWLKCAPSEMPSSRKLRPRS